MQSRRVQHGDKYKGSMLHAIIYKATTQCDKHTEQCEKKHKIAKHNVARSAHSFMQQKTYKEKRMSSTE